MPLHVQRDFQALKLSKLFNKSNHGKRFYGFSPVERIMVNKKQEYRLACSKVLFVLFGLLLVGVLTVYPVLCLFRGNRQVFWEGIGLFGVVAFAHVMNIVIGMVSTLHIHLSVVGFFMLAFGYWAMSSMLSIFWIGLIVWDSLDNNPPLDRELSFWAIFPAIITAVLGFNCFIVAIVELIRDRQSYMYLRNKVREAERQSIGEFTSIGTQKRLKEEYSLLKSPKRKNSDDSSDRFKLKNDVSRINKLNSSRDVSVGKESPKTPTRNPVTETPETPSRDSVKIVVKPKESSMHEVIESFEPFDVPDKSVDQALPEEQDEDVSIRNVLSHVNRVLDDAVTRFSVQSIGFESPMADDGLEDVEQTEIDLVEPFGKGIKMKDINLQNDIGTSPHNELVNDLEIEDIEEGTVNSTDALHGTPPIGLTIDVSNNSKSPKSLSKSPTSLSLPSMTSPGMNKVPRDNTTQNLDLSFREPDLMNNTSIQTEGEKMQNSSSQTPTKPSFSTQTFQEVNDQATETDCAASIEIMTQTEILEAISTQTPTKEYQETDTQTIQTTKSSLEVQTIDFMAHTQTQTPKKEFSSFETQTESIETETPTNASFETQTPTKGISVAETETPMKPSQVEQSTEPIDETYRVTIENPEPIETNAEDDSDKSENNEPTIQKEDSKSENNEPTLQKENNEPTIQKEDSKSENNEPTIQKEDSNNEPTIQKEDSLELSEETNMNDNELLQESQSDDTSETESQNDPSNATDLVSNSDAQTNDTNPLKENQQPYGIESVSIEPSRSKQTKFTDISHEDITDNSSDSNSTDDSTDPFLDPVSFNKQSLSVDDSPRLNSSDDSESVEKDTNSDTIVSSTNHVDSLPAADKILSIPIDLKSDLAEYSARQSEPSSIGDEEVKENFDDEVSNYYQKKLIDLKKKLDDSEMYSDSTTSAKTLNDSQSGKRKNSQPSGRVQSQPSSGRIPRQPVSGRSTLSSKSTPGRTKASKTTPARTPQGSKGKKIGKRPSKNLFVPEPSIMPEEMEWESTSSQDDSAVLKLHPKTTDDEFQQLKDSVFHLRRKKELLHSIFTQKTQSGES